jgi:hypothetical protein
VPAKPNTIGDLRKQFGIIKNGVHVQLKVSDLTVPELLALHAHIADELIARRITRSYNNPTGDLAEYLFCNAFGWNQVGKSNAHIDAVAADGTRYQIKGRRVTLQNKSRQLGVIRDLNGEHFDFLAGVLFKEDYTISRAAIIPCSVVLERAAFVERTNSHRFLLRDDVWNAPGVCDVTEELAAIKF